MLPARSRTRAMPVISGRSGAAKVHRGSATIHSNANCRTKRTVHLKIRMILILSQECLLGASQMRCSKPGMDAAKLSLIALPSSVKKNICASKFDGGAPFGGVKIKSCREGTETVKGPRVVASQQWQTIPG